MIENCLPKQTQVEGNSLKKTDISSSVPTIDLTNLEEEKGRSYPMPISIEDGNYFQDLTIGANGNVLSPLPQSKPLCQSSTSSSAILISSIRALSSVIVDFTTPGESHLYGLPLSLYRLFGPHGPFLYL